MNKPRRPTLSKAERFYVGSPCSRDPDNHGDLRYRRNGNCVMCCKQAVSKRREAFRNLNQNPMFVGHWNEKLAAVKAAALAFAAALDEAQDLTDRGKWLSVLRELGLRRRIVFDIRAYVNAQNAPKDQPVSDWSEQ